MDLKKILQILGIVALSLFVIQLILGLVISFTIGGFIFKAINKIEDKIEVINPGSLYSGRSVFKILKDGNPMRRNPWLYQRLLMQDIRKYPQFKKIFLS